MTKPLVRLRNLIKRLSGEGIASEPRTASGLTKGSRLAPDAPSSGKTVLATAAPSLDKHGGVLLRRPPRDMGNVEP